MHQLDRDAAAPSGFSGYTTKHKCECESSRPGNFPSKTVETRGTSHNPHRPGVSCSIYPWGGYISPTHYVQYTQMINLLFTRMITTRILVAMKGRNNCLWLKLGSEELCNRSCMGEFCKSTPCVAEKRLTRTSL